MPFAMEQDNYIKAKPYPLPGSWSNRKHNRKDQTDGYSPRSCNASLKSSRRCHQPVRPIRPAHRRPRPYPRPRPRLSRRSALRPEAPSRVRTFTHPGPTAFWEYGLAAVQIWVGWLCEGAGRCYPLIFHGYCYPVTPFCQYHHYPLLLLCSAV